MTLQESKKTGLLRLRHLMELTEASEEEMVDERDRIKRLKNREPVKAISSFNLFQTPLVIADLMADRLGDVQGKRVLEPSAGLGRLVAAVDVADGEFILVEKSVACCEQLYGSGWKIIQDDFLECDADRLGGLFDACIMNPPFKMGRDVKHIEHAYGMLKTGGLLVGLCYDGVRQKKRLMPQVDTWELLPEGSFKSEGTGAGVVLITWRKR